MNNNLRTLRKKAGYNQQQFADKLGVTVLTVKRWEKGNPIMSYNLEAIVDVLKCTSDEILGRTSSHAVCITGVINGNGDVMFKENLGTAPTPAIENLEALVVDEDINLFLKKGSIVYYRKLEGFESPEQGLHVVSYSGKSILCEIEKGSKSGLFSLIPLTGKTIKDIKPEMIAEIVWIKRGSNG